MEKVMKKLTIALLVLGLVSANSAWGNQTEVQQIQASIINNIVSGNLTSIKSRINSGNVNIILNENGWTPFILAAAHGQIPIMNYLYKQNPKNCINQTTRGGGTPFMEAARNNQVEVLEWFKQHKLLKQFINKPDTEFHNTALMEVAYAWPAAEDAKAWLLSNGVDKYLKNKSGLTAQEIAQDGRFNSFFAPENFQDPKTRKINIKDQTLFYHVFKGNLSAVNKVNSKTKNNLGSNLLAPALLSGNIENVDKLIADYELKVDYSVKMPGVTINDGVFKNGLLFAAIASSQPKKALAWAVKKQKLKLNVSGINGPFLIGNASVVNNFDMIQYLQKKGANINLPCDQYGQTILKISTEEGLLNSVILLLKAGANVNAQDKKGWTPLMAASHKGDVDIINALFATRKVRPIKNKDGQIALMIAVEYGHVGAVNSIIKHGADVNTKDNHGWTALKFAQFGLKKAFTQVKKQNFKKIINLLKNAMDEK
jgi:ankyrin repeat protein